MVHHAMPTVFVSSGFYHILQRYVDNSDKTKGGEKAGGEEVSFR